MSMAWLAANTKNLISIKRFLTECEFQPEYDKLPLRTIQSILNSAEAEIRRQQTEINALKSALNVVQTEVSNIKNGKLDNHTNDDTTPV